jgi:hypothetical protein
MVGALPASAPRYALLRVLAHPLVQAEIARQLSDIEDLKMHASEPVPTAVARVRARATSDANCFLRS